MPPAAGQVYIRQVVMLWGRFKGPMGLRVTQVWQRGSVEAFFSLQETSAHGKAEVAQPIGHLQLRMPGQVPAQAPACRPRECLAARAASC
jgi:hypothetical protein